ncbi:hypothetical protein [Halomonas caseinilytica]|uniref:hypothetical protein n=1 Tax=Halomonas caseinilytica TaxID=438744 RepID=UPI0008BD3DD7|nr:hypothetical protein [Halomonas caseinilytica]SEN00827.1 hypothetical protein SAMN04487952_10922 [Halomonas caseinilytica]
MTKNQLAKRIDPFDASLRYMLVVVFPKSTSKNFSLVLNIAEGAEQYAVADINGKSTYFVCFGESQSDAGRAVAILDYVRTWKGVQVFSKGKLLQNSYHMAPVLNCYLESQSCRDYQAHCYKVIDDPFSEEVEGRGTLSIRVVDKPSIKHEVEMDRYLFPCNFLFNRFRFQKDHPSSIADQIQASAVKSVCDWCPNFEPVKWRKVGTRKVLKDFFD